MNLPLVWYDIELLPPNDPPLDDEERENDEDEEEDEQDWLYFNIRTNGGKIEMIIVVQFKLR